MVDPAMVTRWPVVMSTTSHQGCNRHRPWPTLCAGANLPTNLCILELEKPYQFGTAGSWRFWSQPFSESNSQSAVLVLLYTARHGGTTTVHSLVIAARSVEWQKVYTANWRTTHVGRKEGATGRDGPAGTTDHRQQNGDKQSDRGHTATNWVKASKYLPDNRAADSK